MLNLTELKNSEINTKPYDYIVLKNFISFFILKFLFWIIWVASLIPFGLGMIWTIPASCVLPFILYDNIIGLYKEDNKVSNNFQGNILEDNL